MPRTDPGLLELSYQRSAGSGDQPVPGLVTSRRDRGQRDKQKEAAKKKVEDGKVEKERLRAAEILQRRWAEEDKRRKDVRDEEEPAATSSSKPKEKEREREVERPQHALARSRTRSRSRNRGRRPRLEERLRQPLLEEDASSAGGGATSAQKAPQPQQPSASVGGLPSASWGASPSTEALLQPAVPAASSTAAATTWSESPGGRLSTDASGSAAVPRHVDPGIR
eukprot:TRINITY_DN36712_c0_g1_i3.p1 TRINITY_DN36712_c0_g1~~TRINITY_DN36712_c0_g1_i3.p1  ORF type:complete len:224 (+),score=51.87 TRINITY_DN36712_c0_g1_i3:77-748(+)